MASLVLETALRRPVARPSRQGPRRLPVGDGLLIVATDRISAFDYVLGSGIPDKGRVLTQLSRFWFDRTRHIVANHLLSADAGALSGTRSARYRDDARRPLDARCARPRRCRSNAWRAAISRARAGRTTRRPAKCAALPLPAGLVESDRLPQPIFTPATKAESGHDLNISFDEAAALVGGELLERLKRLTLAALPVRRGARRVARHHPRRHQVRVRPHRRGRAAADRRDDDARLVALLAAGHLRRPAARNRASTSSSCAIISNRSAGTSSRPCPRCRTTSSPGRARKYLEAYRRLTGHELEGAGA